MFRRARPAAADATSATTADTAPGRGRSDKRSWASMSERLRQQRQDGRRFGEAGDADADGPSAPHPEPAPDTAAGRSDGAVAATPAAVQAAARAPAAQGTAADRDAPRGQDPALALAVRQALGEALAAAPRQPDLEPEARQAETRQAEPGTAEDSSMPVARSADEHKQPARPSGNGRAAAPAAEPERGFGHKQPAPALPAASTSANALLGHVISVAGSVVWAVLDPTGATHAEIGAMVRLQGGQMRSFGIITTLKSEGRRSAEHDRRLVEIRLLGEMAGGTDRFQRGVSSHPALDSPIHMASRDELRAIFARPDKPTVRLGTLHQAVRPAGLRDHRQPARQAFRRARHHGRRQVVRGDRDPARDPGGQSARPHHHARPAQRVRPGVRRAGRAAQPGQPQAALLAAQFRGDRRGPGQQGFARARLCRNRRSCAARFSTPGAAPAAATSTPTTSRSTRPAPTGSRSWSG